MEIEGITLWVFGGVAQFKGMFGSAGAELRIAAAGPAVSLVIGVTLLATAIMAPLPAAVDGGRILRALIWAAKDDFTAATRTAATLGRGFGGFLLAGGLFLALAGGVLGGVWLAFIGWFLMTAATPEAALSAAREALRGFRVRDLMVREDEPLADVVTKPGQSDLHRALVCDHGRLTGLLSMTDAARVIELPAGDRTAATRS